MRPTLIPPKGGGLTVSVAWCLVACLGMVSMLLLSGCREDEYVSYITDEETGRPVATTSLTQGMYVLCEGNMGQNKCTLDYLDLSSTDSTAHYYRNIYAERNPTQVRELGDVGNDIGIYGSRLWMVINCSNKVEVCTADSAHRIGQIDIPNCRSLAFAGPYAYVSSYVGHVQPDTHSPLGRVYRVDTLRLQCVDSVTVGYQPEEMAIVGSRLYVANSGGYRAPLYDDRLTIIDLQTFTTVGDVHVAPNLHRLCADRYGQLWVSSRGDYYDRTSTLSWVVGDTLGGQLDVPVTAFALAGDSLYYIGSAFSYTTGQYTRQMGIVDVRTHQRLSTTLFDAPQIAAMQQPYGIVVHPVQRDFYLMDAANYVTSGSLLHFLPDGTFDWQVRTGDIPSRACFLQCNE